MFARTFIKQLANDSHPFVELDSFGDKVCLHFQKAASGTFTSEALIYRMSFACGIVVTMHTGITTAKTIVVGVDATIPKTICGTGSELANLARYTQDAALFLTSLEDFLDQQGFHLKIS